MLLLLDSLIVVPQPATRAQDLKKDVQAQEAQSHRIRITLTSRNVVNLEKGVLRWCILCLNYFLLFSLLNIFLQLSRLPQSTCQPRMDCYYREGEPTAVLPRGLLLWSVA